MYLAEVRKEQTAIGSLSEFIPVPLSSHANIHKSLSRSKIFNEILIDGRIEKLSQESKEFSISSLTAIYKIRSPVNPANAELSTKNSDSAFLL